MNEILNTKNSKLKTTERGFTLIELLVVITVIGVLTTLITANFVGVRERARDAERKSDLSQIQTALEFYRSDTGSYPATNAVRFGQPLTSGGVTYMQSVPTDPSGGSHPQYRYTYSAPNYTLRACLENERDSQGDRPSSQSPCNGTTTWSYTVVNP